VAAAADSSNIQYSDAPPTATGKESVKETPAKSSNAKNGGDTNRSNTPGSKESHSPNKESSGSTSSRSDAVPGGASHNGGNGGSGQQGTQRSGSGGHGDGAQSGGQASKTVAASKDKGGSSPLVPILIAIAVLAAISIGAVMLRQRRQRGGGSATPISPKAS